MSTRQLGFSSVGPIPWTAVEEYCRSLELESEQREAMHHHVREMDMCFLNHVSKKTKK